MFEESAVRGEKYFCVVVFDVFFFFFFAGNALPEDLHRQFKWKRHAKRTTNKNLSAVKS